MPRTLRPPYRPLRALVALTATGSVAVAALAVDPASAGAGAGPACAPTGRTHAVRLSEVADGGVGLGAVRDTSGVARTTLRALADDGTGWVDRCGQVYVVDRAAAPADRTVADPPAGATVPDDVFALSSRPSSTHTLYLDFDGSTYSGTLWNGGNPVVSAPYSVDADTATFSATERAQIYLAWRSVAEDYAPFDVNVTTRAPSADALSRTSLLDPTYGMPIVVTATNAVGAGCGCGGVAYVNVFAKTNNAAVQPGWVFTNGTGTGGYDLAQAVSHEAGHTFGLDHDGVGSSGYYSGAYGWAPIMGASYDRRLSQWSRGEYDGATTPEDDVAMIARAAPVLPDDHADTAVGATVLAPGRAAAGLIASRADADAFVFLAAGPTTLAVSGPPGVSDLDVLLTVTDAEGDVVARVDPSATSPTDASLDATWTAELPDTPTTLTAVVDGTSHGDPLTAGGYSDYGSLGAYAVTLTTAAVPLDPTPVPPPTTSTPTTPTPPASDPTSAEPSPTPVPTPAADPATPTTTAPPSFVTTRLPAARAGRHYRAVVRLAGDVARARVVRSLPHGLRWRASTSRVVVVGRVHARGVRHLVVELTGVDGTVVHRRFALRVR